MVELTIQRALLTTIATLCLWCNLRVAANIPLAESNSPPDPESVKQLEASMLAILGMDSRPRRPENPVIPQRMLDLYAAQSDDPDYMTINSNRHHALHSNTARSFHHIGTRTHRENKNIANIFFNITTLPKDEAITSAELYLFPHNHTSGSYRVNIHEVVSSPQSPETSITRLIDTKLINSTKVGDKSLNFDITSAVHRWHKKSTNVHGIQVTVHSSNNDNSHVRLRRDADTSDADWNERQPLAVIYTNDPKLPRAKRDSKPRKYRRGSKRVKQECQRREMQVTFKDVGWNDWILAPTDYNAFYCHGECPYPIYDHLNATNHAIVQNIVNEVDPGSVPKPCCVPTDLSPLVLLYYNSVGGVELKTYQDMIVEGCGCR